MDEFEKVYREDSQLEMLKNRMNWLSDYAKDLTPYAPPLNWSMAAYQQAYFDMTGFEWDPTTATNKKRSN